RCRGIAGDVSADAIALDGHTTDPFPDGATAAVAGEAVPTILDLKAYAGSARIFSSRYRAKKPLYLRCNAGLRQSSPEITRRQLADPQWQAIGSAGRSIVA